MNKNLHKAGLIVALLIPLFILPARLSEGQWNNPVNLIGSEIVIFLMSLTCWYSINFIQSKKNGWLSLVLSVLACCVLSNLFYFIFNPYFKDFPFRTAQNPIFVKVLMLSSRGVLMSVVLISTAYFFKRDQQFRYQRLENERLEIEKIKIENKLLEQAGREHNKALYEALSSLENVQHELEHQLYVQSRLLASFTHDVGGPFNYLVMSARAISEFVEAKEYETARQYSLELHKSLANMFTFLKNQLEFTKLPVQQKLSLSEKVNISEIVEQKRLLFEGVIRMHNNRLFTDCDPSIIVSSNLNLLGVVLHNLIDNANKHTLNGDIKISAFSDHGNAIIVCENTGKQVPANILQWINTTVDLKAGQSTSSTPLKFGIGLILVKEITSILKIPISMTSDGAGTKVYLRFSIGINRD